MITLSTLTWLGSEPMITLRNVESVEMFRKTYNVAQEHEAWKEHGRMSSVDIDPTLCRVFTNGTDTIFGLSVEEASKSYAEESGHSFGEGAEIDPVEFDEIPLDQPIKVFDPEDHERTVTRTAREWINYMVTEHRSGSFVRLICSTEY